MKLYYDFSGLAVAIVISTIGAVTAGGSAFILTIFVSAKLINGEMSYGVPLAVGPPFAIIVAIVVFIVIFRRMRSL